MTTDHKDLKNQTFPSYTVEDWIKLAKDSLKDQSIDSLNRQTYENIRLKPLYTKEDIEFLKVEQYPGSEFRTRGFRPLGHRQKSWAISQRIVKRNWNQVKQLLSSALNRGQDTLSFDVDYLENTEAIDFSDLSDIHYNQIPFFLLTKNRFQPILEKVMNISHTSPFGVIATDLLSRHIDKGKIDAEDLQLVNNWVSQINLAHQTVPNIKTILIDTTPYHNGGANALQELAIALAEAVFYIEYMKNHHWQPEQTVNKIVFHFAIGGNFFMEIAKLRAFRALWTTIEKAYELTAYQGVTVSAETSTFTKSALDPFVNILRSGNEAFAAILGGVDNLHVSPYDEIFQENGDFSARIARNTQLILREESHLDKVLDPAGGSYYIESMTNEIVDKAWELFQKIDAMGGIIEALKSGWLQNDINQILNSRLLEVETREQSVIGTNIYANPTEQVTSKTPFKEEKEMSVIPLIPVRLTQEFEKLRKRALLLESKGKVLMAGIICFGQLKDYKSRADFVTGVLATGGIKTNWSQSCMNLEDVKKFVKESQHSYYCICGTDEAYKEYGEQVGKWLKTYFPSMRVDIAGKLLKEEMEKLQVSGIADPLHKNQNIVGKLSSLLGLWEV